MSDREVIQQENVEKSKTPMSDLNVRGDIDIFTNISMSGNKGLEQTGVASNPMLQDGIISNQPTSNGGIDSSRKPPVGHVGRKSKGGVKGAQTSRIG